MCDFTCGGPFEQAQRIRGFEQFMVDIALDRPFAAALMERLTDNAIGFWDAMLTEVGDCVDVVCQGDDLGMQTGLQISAGRTHPGALVKPYHRTPLRLHPFADRGEGVAPFLRGRVVHHPGPGGGRCRRAEPGPDERGRDGPRPVEAGVREGHHVLGGGIDIQRLPSLTIAAIRDEVARAIEIMAPGGGYVFAASHNILPETSGEKTDAAYLAAVASRKEKHRG